jgi:hypothetical protein
VLAFFSVANPQAWWSRYVPQLWGFPVILCLVALREGRRSAELLLGTLALFLLGATSLLHLEQGGWSQFTASQADARARDALVKTLRTARAPAVATQDFGSYIYWLRRQGIPLRWVPRPELRCPAPLRSLSREICVQ